MIDKYKIGNQLKLLRKAKNYTTQELASKVNVSQSYISRFENGKAIPDIEMLDKILTALDTDLSTFFSDELQDIPADLIQLVVMLKELSPEARRKLTEFIEIVLKN
ncbi:helix-turn-helix domain-containing protein [Oceanobacillus salinisoli]|uniref:helix-turn-helix domain-containing protein n=1 Tax=Oceanobacillus salinisoli TaxID=2678611 RepID=UPI0018CC2F5C|nr:helix-turn-helix transcriptional regulator [Oceanobacillus salinisoli]